MDLGTLDESNEITMRTRRRDGSWSSRPIWVVVVDQDAYVRSVRGDQGAWYRKVRGGGQAEIVVDGQAVPISAESVHDEGMNKAVSDAYQDKYAAFSPDSTKSINDRVSRVTTMRLNVPD